MLQRIQLEPFSDEEHQRQLGRLLAGDEERLSAAQHQTVRRALRLASGNPGLLRKLVDYVRTDAEAAPALLDEVQAYLAEGREPTDSQVSDYLQSLAITRMFDRLSPVEHTLLALSKSLLLPVPVSVMVTLAEDMLGAGNGGVHCQRLLSFGLWDAHTDLCDPQTPACAINALVQPRVTVLTEADIRTLWRATVPLLQQEWSVEHSPPIGNHMLLTMATQVNAWTCAQERAQSGLQYLLGRHEYTRGYALAEVVVPQIDAPSYDLLRVAAELAMGAGEADRADGYFTRAVEMAPEPRTREDAMTFGALVLGVAQTKFRRGELDAAWSEFEKARDVLQSFGLERERTIAIGRIADILQARGELDEALRIRTEEELPVYERLGDVRELTVTLNQLYDLYMQKQDFQQAFEAIARAFQLVQGLGIPDGIGVVGFKLGQFLLAAGQTAEARTVLGLSRQASVKLGWQDRVQAIDTLLRDHGNP